MITKTETLEDNPPAGGKKEEKDEEETKLKKKISKKERNSKGCSRLYFPKNRTFRRIWF